MLICSMQISISRIPNAAAYMFEAARLTTLYPNMKEPLRIFRLIVNKFPESEYAPEACCPLVAFTMFP